MKTFNQHITEANRLWNYLYSKHKGIFYRGEKKGGRTGVGFGVMGDGIYLTWSEGMARAYADLAGGDAKVNKYKVKRGLKIADVKGNEIFNIKDKLGFHPADDSSWYSAAHSKDKSFNKALTYELKKLKFDGVVSDDVAEGIVIFDKKNVKVVK